MARVFVLSHEGKPLMPCVPARARILVKSRQARFIDYRIPTIRMLRATEEQLQPLSLNLDPGAKTTGVAIVASFKRKDVVVFAANLEHRDDIKKLLQQRAMYRRGRRYRNTRCRQARFNNRSKPEGWLPPSLMARVQSVKSLVVKLLKRATLLLCNIETVSFDIVGATRASAAPTTIYADGARLPRSTSLDALKAHYQYTCQYCCGASGDTVLEREHIRSKALKGSDVAENLTLSCRTCNQLKGTKSPQEFADSVTGSPKYVAAVKAYAPLVKLPSLTALRYASLMNSIAVKLHTAVAAELNCPINDIPAVMTKQWRLQSSYPKDHWIDAAVLSCINRRPLKIPERLTPLIITARKTHDRRMVKHDKYGFPCSKPKGASMRGGLKTGDLCRIDTRATRAAYRGSCIAPITITGSSVDFTAPSGQRVRTSSNNAQLLLSSTGYKYSRGQSVRTLHDIAAARPAAHPPIRLYA